MHRQKTCTPGSPRWDPAVPAGGAVPPSAASLVTGPGLSMAGMAGIGFDIVDAVPGRHLVISVATSGPVAFTMGYLLQRWGTNSTRVLVRVRGASSGPSWQNPLIRFALGPGDFVMVRRQLAGVKERAEFP